MERAGEGGGMRIFLKAAGYLKYLKMSATIVLDKYCAGRGSRRKEDEGRV